MVPVHGAAPASSPVALNLRAPGAGRFVIPGLIVKDPVGATAVPPHVHVVVAALAGAASMTAINDIAPSAIAVMILPYFMNASSGYLTDSLNISPETAFQTARLGGYISRYG